MRRKGACSKREGNRKKTKRKGVREEDEMTGRIIK